MNRSKRCSPEVWERTVQVGLAGEPEASHLQLKAKYIQSLGRKENLQWQSTGTPSQASHL